MNEKTRNLLRKLQDKEATKNIQDPTKAFGQIANNINLKKIEDEDTRLMVGALINLGGRQRSEYASVVQDSIDQLMRVQKQSNELNHARDNQLHEQLHESLAMFDVVGSHDECIDKEVPGILKRGAEHFTSS